MLAKASAVQAMIAVGAVRDGEDGPLLFEAKGEVRRAKARVDRRPALALPDWIARRLLRLIE